MVEEKTETRAEAQPAPSPAVEAQPAVKAQVQPATRPAAASDQPARTMRVMLKHSALSPQPAVAPEVAEMWGKLPRHIQFLMGTQPQEVAQHSYKQFKETRDEMIQRLLDPSLSLEEAARILNVCPTTVRRYTNRGVLPHFRTVGNQRRFRLSDVLAFLETLSGHSGDGEELEA
jgi:excisionase family DNA binding protein